MRRLDQLPPAALLLTVIRTESGCQRPVVVRYGIAGNAAIAAPIGGPAPTAAAR